MSGVGYSISIRKPPSENPDSFEPRTPRYNLLMTKAADRLDISRFVDIVDYLSEIPLGEDDDFIYGVLAKLSEVLGSDRLSILLWDPDEGEFFKLFTFGFSLEENEYNGESEIARYVVEKRSSILIENIGRSKKFTFENRKRYRTPSFYSAPMIYRNNVVGVISVSNIESPKTFLDKERYLSILVKNLAKMIYYHLVFKRKEEIERVKEGLKERLGEEQAERSTGILGFLEEMNHDLSRSKSVEDMMSLIAERIRNFINFEIVGIIYGLPSLREDVYITCNRNLSVASVEKLFGELTGGWFNETRRLGIRSIEEAKIIAKERIITQLPLGVTPKTENVLVHIDGDLFGIASIGSRQGIQDEELKIFRLVAHQLLLNVKKYHLHRREHQLDPTDTLTGLLSQTEFYRMLDSEFERAKRYRVPLSIAFIDIDHFRDINEAYGTNEGDGILRALGRVINSSVRKNDILSRYGGERFVVLLPETTLNQAMVFGDRICKFIANHPFHIESLNIFIRVTASLGITSYRDHNPTSTAQFVEFCETALYFAKKKGRNQVVSYSHVLTLFSKNKE